MLDLMWKRCQLAINVRRRIWCNLHHKKVRRRIQIGLSLSAVEAEEGEADQHEEEAEQGCDGEQDVDEFSW